MHPSDEDRTPAIVKHLVKVILPAAPEDEEVAGG